MKKINFYNMHGINCWIINLKPFGSDASDKEICSLQNECVENKIFGIGWRTEYFDTHTKTVLDENTKRAYKDLCTDKNPARDSAVDRMSEIKCGDLAIMRLRDGHIYLGKVTGPAFHDSAILEDEHLNRLSWICMVEKWLDFGDETMIPSEIMGRFCVRQQATISRIASYKQRLLMIAMYDKTNRGETDVPKLALNENNFARALS